MLGVSLVWKSPSPGVYVNLDLQVTLLNRENFIENLQFSVSNAQYSMPQDIHQNRKIGDTRNVLENGNRSFLSIADLLSYRPRFVDTNGEFQIELRVSNIKTAFINSFTIQKVFTSKGSHDAENDVSLDYDKMEIKSEIFRYGGFFWEATVRPQPPLLTTASWASAAVMMGSSNRKSFRNSVKKRIEANRIASLDNLGISVTILRKPAKSFHPSSESISKGSNKNKSNNNNNNISEDVKLLKNHNNVPLHQKGDELLAKLTYKVNNKLFSICNHGCYISNLSILIVIISIT